METWLGDDKGKELEKIREHVRDLWKNNTGPPEYTLHDDSHNGQVENALHKLLPEKKYLMLSEEERFYLLAAAWLHDVGMILSLFGKVESCDKVREEHHARSKQYITSHYETLGLKLHEALIIGEICCYHRKSEDILSCRETYGEIRARLLAGYLRLADAIHKDPTRISESLLKLFLAMGMSSESKFHWIKNRWVKEVIPKFDNLTIVIHLFAPKSDGSKTEKLRHIIEDEVREELESVKDVLIRGGITYYLEVKTEIGPIDIPDDMRIELKQVLSNIEIQDASSSSDVANNAINTVLEWTDQADVLYSYSMIRDYRETVRNVIEVRPCHILLKRIYNIVRNATARETNVLSDSEARRILDRLKINLESLRDEREKSLKELVKHAETFLVDRESILLFGYSSIVIRALKNQDIKNEVKQNTKIYVAECKSKTRFNYKNEIIYCDGISYAIEVKKCGFEHVYIVPDITIANLISRKLIKKVVFGANGVGYDGTFGHTAGHLTIAELAYRNRIPIYVIADSYKFGKLKPERDLERRIDWLTMDRKMLSLLDEHGIQTMNPREDIVEPEKISQLITDEGAFPPTRIPNVIKEKAERYEMASTA